MSTRDIIIFGFDPPGLEIAICNEAGVDWYVNTCESWEKQMERFWKRINRSFEDFTSYVSLRRTRQHGLELWACVYLDYTPEDPAVQLADMSKRLVKGFAANGRADLIYNPEERIIHCGIWQPEHHNLRWMRSEFRRLLELVGWDE